MRYLQEIPHAHFRIGLYAWNNKFILKIESGPYEQTYKVSEMDVASPEAVLLLLDEPFLAQIGERFRAMDTDWQAAQQRYEFD
ncbi:MAG: hypothetical protein H7Z72_07990 [Bacteroidetes bacterium]|nr:hypothetical protein [Fibrella sp.]